MKKYGIVCCCLLVIFASSCGRKKESSSYSYSETPSASSSPSSTYRDLPALPRRSGGKPSKRDIQKQVYRISKLRLPYVFGGSSPSSGGMDCSGSIQYLLKQSGFTNVPRTSFAQYEWVKEHSRIKRGKEIQANKLEFGDLIFWGGTYDSGHKVSHVMMYLGQQPDGKLHMYGARSKSLQGLNGGGVDIHELRAGTHKNLIGYGRIPGF